MQLEPAATNNPVPYGSEQDKRILYRKVGWRLLPILMVCYILAYLDRQNVGFAKLEFMGDLGFSEAVFGLGGGLFYLGYCLFEVPSNLLLKKIGARATLLRIMVAWGLVATLFAFMVTPNHYYLLRLFLGVAEAGFFPGILLFISLWIPASRRASFTALFMAAMPISGIIGSPVSGAIMEGMDGFWALKGWQWMFIIQGIPSCLMGIYVYLVLADSPAKAKWLNEREKEVILGELEAEAAPSIDRPHKRLVDVIVDPKFYGLATMAITLLACIAGLSLWMPSIIRASGVTNLFEVGLYAAIPSLLASVCQQLNARHSDRTGERRWHAAIPTLMAAAGFACLPFASGNLPIAMACLSVISMGLLSSTGPYWTLPSSQFSGAATAGGIAIVTTIGGFGAFASTWIVGVLNTVTGSTATGLWYFSALAFIGPVAMLISTRPSKAVSGQAK